jgi:hypothetical protein
VSRPVCLRAWILMEGHLLPDGTRIVSVIRDPTTYRVYVTTSDGAQWTVQSAALRRIRA